MVAHELVHGRTLQSDLPFPILRRLGRSIFNGPEGIRTLDLYSAIVALSQLSYRPWSIDNAILSSTPGIVKLAKLSRHTIAFRFWPLWGTGHQSAFAFPNSQEFIASLSSVLFLHTPCGEPLYWYTGIAKQPLTDVSSSGPTGPTCALAGAHHLHNARHPSTHGSSSQTHKL